jgi:hypothetical protein
MPYHLRKEPPVSTEVEDGWDTSALDMVAKRKILASARNPTLAIKLTGSHFTD